MIRAFVTGLSAGLLVLILGLAAAVIAVPAVVGGSALSILSGSMEPTLPAGTLIIVKPTPVEEIRVGDVITFQLESGQPTLVTHRVTERITDTASDEVRFITQGDANNVADAEPILPVQIRGTVWYAVPYLGWVNSALSGATRAWLIPTAALALFAYAAFMIGSGFRERRATSPSGSDHVKDSGHQEAATH